MNEIKSIILAAGKGTRMDSDLPKVLHKVDGTPMIQLVMDTFKQIESINENILVLGHKKELVLELLGSQTPYVLQNEQLGTGHAVLMAKEYLKDFKGDIFIAYGDTPLVTVETINKFIEKHYESNSVCSVLTAHLDNPTGYGRIVKRFDYVMGIVEEVDADQETRDIKEVNSGVYIVNSEKLFQALDNIGNNNNKNEYYLTDIVEYFVSNNLKVNSYMTSDILEIQGINTKEQLRYVESVIREKRRQEAMV